MKNCSRCTKTKTESEFNKGQSWCRICVKVYDKERYESDKGKRASQNKSRRKDLREWSNKIKSGPCTDCDNTYPPIVMHWDHIENDKEFNVGNMVARGFGIEKISKEISKCELVCANCHAIRTSSRFITE